MSEVPEYRVTVRIRNNLLLRLLERSPGFESVPKFCRKHGLSYTRVCELLRLDKKGPYTVKGDWTEIAEHLASILKVTPDQMFPDRYLRGEIAATSVEREVSDADLARLIENKKLVEELLVGVSPREKLAIEAHFGIGREAGGTLDEVGEEFGVSRERARQLIRSGIRQMRSKAYRRHHLMSGERYNELAKQPYYIRPEGEEE